MDDQQRKYDENISFYQSRLPLLPRSHPLHALGVYGLGATKFARCMLLSSESELDDLEQSILGFTEAILALPLPLSPHINTAFDYLTFATYVRAAVLGHPEDVKYSVIYLRYWRGLPHDVHHPLSCQFTNYLVSALAFRAGLGLGDVDPDIEEMADLCDELLDSNGSTNFLTRPVMAFAATVEARDEESLEVEIPSEKVIACLRRVIIRLPDSPPVSIVLAKALFRRFALTVSDDDYNESMAIFDKVIGFPCPGDKPSLYQQEALEFAVRLAFVRFATSGKPEHLERAIYRNRTLLDRLSLDHPVRDYFVKQHSLLEGMRVDDTGAALKSESSTSESGRLPSVREQASTLLDRMSQILGHPARDNAITQHSSLQGVRFDGTGIAPKSESSTSEPGRPPSFRDLTASLTELSVKRVPKAISDKHILTLISSMVNSSTEFNIADIEDGVNYCQQLISSYPNHRILASNARICLGVLLYRAFECTNEVDYLNRAISAARDSLNHANSRVTRSPSLRVITQSLLTRLSLLKRKEDSDELIQLFPVAVENVGEGSPRLQYLCQWASVARDFGHSSVSTAYDRAMSSMQICLTGGPNICFQHTHLVAMRGSIKSLPFDYASHQIHTNQVEQAIATLERGRSLLWSEMRSLRIPIDQIRSIDRHLADNFTTVNRELEMITLAISPSSNDDGRDSDIEGMDPFGHLVVRQRKLFDDREKLISQIRALPGFDTFLKPPSFDTLRSAACRGPVIIINHSIYRSDIIILHHNSPPSLIDTSDDFYARATKLKNDLLGARRKGLESNSYEYILRFVLEELYELVGLPVIKRLNELNVPEQSRIWWCPTSVFCSLPLHAMGPIPSDMGHQRYFLDLYIPSYIPSLSALIESRKPGSQAIGKPSILLVAQPDENIPQALKEMKAVQVVDTQVTTLFSAKATPTAVLARLPDHQFAHIVCHGMLSPGKPFESSFRLHNGERLQLLDVVRSRLPDAEFAFLSVSHTAELTSESISDEVLHLAAAMQFCGFRSVVGTMWAMADLDGPDLARHFYQSVFSNEGQGGRYYERTAEALRDAVLNLRRKGGISLERWVNFVHYGA